MDRILVELLGIDSAQAFNFFSASLREEIRGKNFRIEEMLYVASVLAHYSQTSCVDTVSMPALRNISEFFDNFVLNGPGNDVEMLEFGGSQVLFLAGFFRDPMSGRHNVKWYDQIGQSFYDRAGEYSIDARKRELFGGLAESLPKWNIVCSNLRRTFHENRFVLRIN